MPPYRKVFVKGNTAVYCNYEHINRGTVVKISAESVVIRDPKGNNHTTSIAMFSLLNRRNEMQLVEILAPSRSSVKSPWG